MGPGVDLGGFDFAGVALPAGLDLAGAVLPTGLQWAGALIGPNLDLSGKTVTGSMVGVDLRGSTLAGFKAHGVAVDGTEELDAGFSFVPDGALGSTLVGPGVSLEATRPAWTSPAPRCPTPRSCRPSRRASLGSAAPSTSPAQACPPIPLGTPSWRTRPPATPRRRCTPSWDPTSAWPAPRSSRSTPPRAWPSPAGYAFLEKGGKFTLFGPGVDLRIRDLTGYDAAGVDLTGALLEQASLGAGTRLYGLKGGAPASLPDGYAFVADAGQQSSLVAGPGLDLSGADLDGFDFDFSQAAVSSNQVPAQYAVASGVLLGPDLVLPDLSGKGIDLSGRDLTGCDLSATADFSGLRTNDVTAAGTEALPAGYAWVPQSGNRYAIVGPGVTFKAGYSQFTGGGLAGVQTHSIAMDTFVDNPPPASSGCSTRAPRCTPCWAPAWSSGPRT